MTDTDSSNIYNTDNYKEKFKKLQYKQFTKLWKAYKLSAIYM